MSTEKIQFAKIVASPTDDSWSQVYSAGNLYAVVSLTKKTSEEDATLNVIGKGIINNLEAEFFGLETKNLDSIKSALENTIESTPDKVHLNVILIFIKKSHAYVYLVGLGEIILQRDTKKATILSQPKNKKSEDERTVIAGSGPLRNKDLLLLKTPEFDEIIPAEPLKEAFEASSADEAAEILSPLVHGKEKGGASAVFLTYLTETSLLDENEDNDLKKDEEEKIPEPDEKSFPSLTDTPKHPVIDADNEMPNQLKVSGQEQDPQAKDYFMHQEPATQKIVEKKPFTFPRLPVSLPKVKKTYLIITTIILVLLLGSIIYTSTQKENAKTRQEFEQIYSRAEKEIEEGTDLEELNANVAEDNFLRAKKLLEDNKNKFQTGTTERDQIDELLAKLDKKVGGQKTTPKLQAKAVDSAKSPLLELLLDKKAELATRNDANDLFYLTSKKIAQLPVSGEEKNVFENDNDWTTPVGMGAFGSNVYVLDQKDGLLKFVAGSNGYGKTTYFKSGTNPDLTKSTGMAIDASIYILYSNGLIEKYTRGEKDTFTLSGLKKPLKSPTIIFTIEEMDNIYILDNGNSRIVKLDKSGNFKSEYNASILKTVRALDISEKDKSAFVLSGNKVYEISLK